jgi:molecular chaperone GrpE (heat shock protein)
VANLNEVEQLQKQMEKLKKQYDEALHPCRNWTQKCDGLRAEMKQVRDRQEQIIAEFLGEKDF